VAANTTAVAAANTTGAAVASTKPTKVTITNATVITVGIAATALMAGMASHTFLTAIMVAGVAGCIATL